MSAIVIRMPMLAREARLEARSFEPTATGARIAVCWTTGATVRRRKFEGFTGISEFDEELIVSSSTVRLDHLNAGAPFLDTHGRYSLKNVLGAVVPGSARLADGRGYATIRLSRAEADRTAVEKIRDGLIRNVSVGYRIHAVEKKERKDTVPLHRIVDWEPMEISAVPIGADPGAVIQGEARSALRIYECAVFHAGDYSAIRAARARMEARQAQMELRAALREDLA